MIHFLASRLAETREMLATMEQNQGLQAEIQNVASDCVTALRHGGKLIFSGNGGSAADSQHLAAELVGRYGFDRPAIPALAITTDTSILTAVSNDYGYQHLFARQVEALGKAGDILFGLTTSGKSQNVLNAFRQARTMGLKTVAMTGAQGILNDCKDACDHCIAVPSMVTPHIQEGHIIIGHLLCELIEQKLFSAVE